MMIVSPALLMRFLIVSLALIAISTPAIARENVLDIQEVTSPKGIKAWLVEDHSIPVISIEISFTGAGALTDPKSKQGLSRMLSNMLDEGAGDLSSQAFQKELRDQSISLSFSSSRDTFNGSLKTLKTNKDRALELLKLSLTKPRFDAEPLSRMRAANESRIRSSVSDPEWIAARIMNDQAFSGHAYAMNTGGTLSTLKTITSADLKKSMQENFSLENLKIGVCGDITETELQKLLDDVFGALPAKRKTQTKTDDITLQNQGSIALYKKEIPQTIIEIMQPGLDKNHPDYHGAQVMNQILGASGFGSRLTDEIREKRGLTYGIYSYLFNLEHSDTLAVSTSTGNENVQEMLGLIRTEWDKMKQAPPSTQELTDAKTYMIGALPLSLTSTDKIASLLASLQSDGLPIDYLENRNTAIRSATPDDILRISKTLLNADQFTTVLVGAPQNVTPTITVEKLPNVE
jgi:zinc protease